MPSRFGEEPFAFDQFARELGRAQRADLFAGGQPNASSSLRHSGSGVTAVVTGHSAAPDDNMTKADPRLARNNAILTFAAACLAPALYLLFVTHYSMNVPFEDDWTVVPLIHAALHGQLTFGALWSLHNENRILVPNLAFVALGVLTRDDLIVIIEVSAAIFVATFLVFLIMVRSYLNRHLTPLLVLVLGLTWFSVEAWQNALSAFQLSWYLILFFLMSMLYLLMMRTSVFAYGLAMAAAVAASFSFLQGLALWPVGMVCLVWTLPSDPRRWSRIKKTETLVWLGAAIGTTVASLWGYQFKPLGCVVRGRFQFTCTGSVSSFALHHPLRTAEFLFVEIGDVIPNSTTLWMSGLLGAVLFAVALFVVVQSVRHRHEARNCLPVALITFGLLFDLLVAVAHVELLTQAAPSSTFTMPNLLILTAIITYACGHIGLESGRLTRFRSRVLLCVGVVLVTVQVVVATHSGIANARSWDQRLTTSARLVVNLDDISTREHGCYLVYGVFVYLIFAPGVFRYIGFTEARQDHLTVFSPGPLQKYRTEGLPHLPQCRDH